MMMIMILMRKNQNDEGIEGNASTAFIGYRRVFKFILGLFEFL